MTMSFYAGVFLTIAGTMGLIRHFLLEPRIKSYPRAPGWLLHVFFVTSVVFIFMGIRYLFAWYLQENGIPPNASPTMGLLSFVLMFYKGSMLVNVLRQHYPPSTWARLNAIQDRLCPKQ